MSRGPEERLEALLVPYLRGELEPLEARWVESRLSASEPLRVRSARLGSALDAARAQAPRLEPDHKERLIARVRALAPRRRAPLPWAMAGAAFATGLAVAVGFWVGSGAGDAPPSVAIAPVAAFDFSGDERVALTVAAEQRSQVTPHLRTLVSKSWVGRLDGDARETHVRVERGTIAFGFRGGLGRRLEVSTAHAQVRVVGTRFSVEVSPDGAATTVEVAQGRVEVWRGRQKLEVPAGFRAVVSGERASLRRATVAAALNDPFLVEITADEHASTAPKKGKPKSRARGSRPATRGSAPASSEKEPVAESPRPTEGLEAELRALERADALARAGNHAAAVRSYHALLAAAPSLRMAQMARLGRARSLGHLGQLREALRALRSLSEVPGEVGRQARLSRCEVQRRFQPCAAQRCYGALADAEDPQLAREAARLFEGSRASGLRCEAGE